jgi:hypothetical protein
VIDFIDFFCCFHATKGLDFRHGSCIMVILTKKGIIMAYMNQQKKAIIASKLKPVLKKYGVKGSLKVSNHSTIVLNVKFYSKLQFHGR